MTEQYIEILENVNSYYELYNKIKDYDIWKIDKIFILLTKYIFLLHQNFINITKNIYLYDGIPLKLKKTYNLFNKYDLLLETNDNEIYQIHSKFIFNKMEKFKIEKYFDNSNFKYIYVTNVSDIYDEIMKFNNITCIFGDFFNRLDKDFFNNIRNKVKGKNIEYKTTKLLKYQENLIKKSIKYFDDHDEGIVNITNQNSKLESIINLDKEIGTSLTLILVPSLYTINKYYQEISKKYIDNSDVKIMIVYSYNEINDIENINGFLSCDDKKIKYNLNKYINRYDKLIIISTYYSINKLYPELNKKNIDLVIYDDIINMINSKIIVNFYNSCYKNIKSQLKISLTSQYFILDNTAKKFGKEYFTYTLRKAIDDGLMCDYEILLIYIDNKQIDTYKLDNNIDIDITEYYYLALSMIFNSLFDKKEISHLLTLHNDKKNSIVSILSKIAEKNILIDKYDCNDSYKKRNDLINNLKDYDKTILIAKNILNKDNDIDMSIIDSICFIDNISNYALNSIHILQNIFKNYKGKNKIKIIIPIVEYDINYDNLITIVKSLNIYDEAVKEYFIALKYKNKINKKFPLRLEYYDYSDRNINNFNKVCDNIKTAIMKNIYYWYIMIEKIEKYIKINNKLPKINNENKEIKYLGIWFNQQKSDYTNFTNEMTDINKRKIWEELINNYKKKKIINISPKNIEDTSRVKKWFDNLNKLKKFININNKLPYQSGPNKKLYRWFVNQKMKYKKNIEIMTIPIIKKQWEEFVTEYKKKIIGDKEIADNDLNTNNWINNWINKLQSLKEFININNRLPHNLDNKIYRWFIIQKLYYKKNIKIMKIPIIKNLWEEFIAEYKKYFTKNIINNELKTKNNELKTKNNELKTKNNKLKPKNNKLNINKWINKIESLKNYINTYNKLPSTIDKNAVFRSLAVWQNVQIKNYNKKQKNMKNDIILNKWKEFILEYNKYYNLINDIITINKTKRMKSDKRIIAIWFKKFNKLKLYIDVNKNIPFVFDTNKENIKIANWLQRQINYYNKNIKTMIIPIILDKWKEFILEYNIYFENTNNTKLIKKKFDYLKDNTNKNYKNREQWLLFFNKLKLHLEKYNAMPSIKSNNEDIYKLASWVKRQMFSYNKKSNIMKNINIYNKWKEFTIEYEKYFITSKNKNLKLATNIDKIKNIEKKWNNKFNILKLYIDLNKKRPSIRDNKTKNIASWLFYQSWCYKNKSGPMQIPSIESKWKNFISEYIIYFPNNVVENNVVENNVVENNVVENNVVENNNDHYEKIGNKILKIGILVKKK